MKAILGISTKMVLILLALINIAGCDEDSDADSLVSFDGIGYAVGTDGNDLHGAGAVRFDAKSEDGGDGPDGERYYNYVRLVRDAY